MSAKILDGKKLSEYVQLDLANRVKKRLDQGLRMPGLAVIKVGDNPASEVYVRNKRNACKRIGIKSFASDLPVHTSQQQVLDLIETYNNNPQVDGILVQLPVPKHINPESIIEKISPDKDVDGFHPYNIGRLALRIPLLRPCTPRGIIHLLESTKVDIRGKHAVIVGASNIVGRPMGLELLIAGCTVTTCHRFTKNLSEHVARSDILIVAIGRPGVVDSSWIPDHCIVIDVGINRLENGKLVGDIDFNKAKDHVAWITPVPGGVGPMTVASLLQNTIDAADQLR